MISNEGWIEAFSSESGDPKAYESVKVERVPTPKELLIWFVTARCKRPYFSVPDASALAPEGGEEDRASMR